MTASSYAEDTYRTDEDNDLSVVVGIWEAENNTG